MFTEITYTSTPDALNVLKTEILSYPANLDIVQIYVKGDDSLNEKLNEIKYFLSCKRPAIIAFEINAKSGKIFWRLTGDQYYILEISDDVGGIVTVYCAKFIAEELKEKHTGLLSGYEKYFDVAISNVGNTIGHNLIIDAINKSELIVVKELVKREFDIDYQDLNGLDAIDHACIKYMNEKNANIDSIISGDIILALLEANSTYSFYKSNKLEIDFADLPQKVKDFTQKIESLHDNLIQKNFDALKSAFEAMPNMIYFYNRNNESIMNTALGNYNKEAYELLVSYGISTGRHEDLDTIFQKFKDKQELCGINQNHSKELPEAHIFKIISKIFVINNCGRRCHNWTKYIMDALQILDKNIKCSKILKVVALCKNLKVYLDFKNYATNFINPSSSQYTHGEVTTKEVIRIGAKSLLDNQKKNNVIGVLIHEFCHLAVLKTFMNNFDPYSIGDQTTKESFELAVEECKNNEQYEHIVQNVSLSYPLNQQHSEFIVTVVQMIMQFYSDQIEKSSINIQLQALLIDDGNDKVLKITHIINVFPLLFNYFETIVQPALDAVLKPLKILEDKSAKIKFGDLTEPMRAKLLYQKINFQGASTTLFEVLKADTEICQHLSSDQIRDLLTKKTSFFDELKIPTKPANIKRRFIDGSDDATDKDPRSVKIIIDSMHQDGIIFLADISSSGKSNAFIELGQQLKEKFKNFLIPLICLKNSQTIISKWQTMNTDINIELIEQMFLEIFNLQNNFEIEVLKKLFKENQIIILFDGLDKLNPKESEFLLKVATVIQQKTHYNLNNESVKIQQWISTRLTTCLKNSQLFESIYKKIYKLAPYSSDEIESHIQSAIKEDNSYKLQALVKHCYFFDAVNSDPNCKYHGSMINAFLELCSSKKVEQAPELLNFYDITSSLYIQQKDKCDGKSSNKLEEPAKMPLERIMQINALHSKFNEESKQFAALKNWERKKIPKDKIEQYGFFNFDTHDPVKYWKFFHGLYVDFFVSYFLLDILFADDDRVLPEEANVVVDFLIKMSISIKDYDVIQKVMLDFLKPKLSLRLKCKNNENCLNLNIKVRSVIIENMTFLRNSIINSTQSVEALKFWSIILVNNPDILKGLWQTEKNETILSKNNFDLYSNPLNLIKILEFLCYLFGREWHCSVDQMNGYLSSNQNRENDQEYEQFERNLKSLLKIIKDTFEPYKAQNIDNNYLPNNEAMIKIKSEILDFCNQKCNKFNDDRKNIFNNIFDKFINCTDDLKLQNYFCNKFDDKKNIFSWKVFFGMKYFKNDVLGMELF